MKHHAMTSVEMRRCIDNCTECQESCLATLRHCLVEGGAHAEADHVGTLLDCARTCQLSAEMMVRESSLHPRMCGLCAEACERCAEECERFADDAMMQKCAEVCRSCVRSCQEMAGMSA